MRRWLVVLLMSAVALVVPPAVPGSAATPGQALVGVFPSYNLSTVDTTNGGVAAAFLQPDLGAPGNGAGGYLNAMNAWQ
ncbi:MAG: hypothetical protein ABR549_08230, partial [Mycobacteriales bacterium]